MNLFNSLKFLSVAGLIALSATVSADDRFAIVVSDHDKLVIFAADGKRAAELNPPSIASSVNVGTASFQVSYGRDTNGRLTAILTPTAAGAPALHFKVVGKNVDATDAVVTLTFAQNLKSVTVDPGYVGTVEVDQRRLGHRHLAEDMGPGLSAPAPTEAPAPEVASVANTASMDTMAPATTTPQVVDNMASVASTPAPEAAPDISKPLAPAPLASQLDRSIIGQDQQQSAQVVAANRPPSEVLATAKPESKPVGLYWSEPVTAPDGTAPSCAADEIKLVEIHGVVSVRLPGGEEKQGVEGMTVPSGSIVATRDDASAALFMGGINSARLMPHCTLTVTQALDNGTRHNGISLDHGAVFTRVGHREGETEDFQIKTVEATTVAETNNMLAYRGSNDDYAPVTTATLIQKHLLYAWNPPALGRSLMSDVASPLVSASATGRDRSTPTASASGTVFIYTPNGTSTLNITTIKTVVAASNASNGQNSPNANDPNTILQNVLTSLIPFNSKLSTLLNRVNSGSASPSDLAFYRRLITVFFNTQLPGLTRLLTAHTAPSTTEFGILAAKRLLTQDLQPFNASPLTPF